MNSQLLKGLFLVTLVVAMAPMKAKAEAADRMTIWKNESSVRIKAALMFSHQEVIEAQNTEPENVYDFSEEGFQIVVVN